MYVDYTQANTHNDIIQAKYKVYLKCIDIYKKYIRSLTFTLSLNTFKIPYTTPASSVEFYLNHYTHSIYYNFMLYSAEIYANRYMCVDNDMFGWMSLDTAVDMPANISECYRTRWSKLAQQRARNILVNRYGVTIPLFIDEYLGVPIKEKIPEITVLFLDIDGVLNSTSGAIKRFDWDEGYDLHDENLTPFEILITQFKELKIVISSTWRMHYRGDFSAFAKTVFAGHPEIQSRIIGLTPRIPEQIKDHDSRGVEIMQWLYQYSHTTGKNNTPVKRIIVLDDEHIDLAVKKWTFYIDNRVGFNYADMNDIIRLVKDGEFDFPPILTTCPEDCALNVKPDVTTK